jgi:WD40 repeat protein
MAAPFRRLLPTLALLLLTSAAPAEPPARTDAQGDPLPDGALARLGTLRFRDGNFVNLVALSPDGKTLAMGGNQGMRLLELTTGKELRTLKTGGPGFVNFNQAVFSPDGKVLATADFTGRIQFWNPATGESTGQIAPPAPAPGGFGRGNSPFTFSGDGKYVAVGADNFGRDAKNQATVYEVATAKQVSQVEVLHNYSARAYLSGDGKTLVTTGSYMNRGGVPEPPEKQQEMNRTIEVWDAANGKEVRKLHNDSGFGLINVAFSPDGKQIATVSQNGGLVVWNLADGKEVRRLAGRRNLGVYVGYSPDGKTLAAASFDGVVQTWDAATGKRQGLYDVPRNFSQAGHFTFTTGGRLLVWGTTGQSVAVWDVFAEKPLTPAGGHQSRIATVAFTPDGKGVVSVSGDGTVCTWDAAGKEVKRVQIRIDENQPFAGGFMYLNGVTLAPDGKHALALTGYGTTLFDLAKGREVCTFSQGGFGGNGVVGAFSPDGSRVASSGYDPKARRSVLRLYDVGTGQELRAFEGLVGDLKAVAFAPDGKTVAAASTSFQAGQVSDVRVWEAGTGKEAWNAARPQTWMQGLAFSADGSQLATLEQSGVIIIYDSAGHELRKLGAEGGAGNGSLLAYSPDGRLLTVASYDFAGRKTHLRLYETATGSLRHDLIGHEGQVTALAFSADGKRLASGGNDTTVLLWDLTGRTGEEAPKGKLTADEADKLWEALSDADARNAFKAMRRLEASPEEALAMLTKHVKPAEGAGSDADAINKLIAGLDADSFDEREKAGKELAALGKVAERQLKKALAGNPSAEAKRAIEQLLEKIKDQAGPPPEQVRPLRAVELLEHMGTPEAKKLMEALAKGRAGATLTEAAKAAVARMEHADKP